MYSCQRHQLYVVHLLPQVLKLDMYRESKQNLAVRHICENTFLFVRFSLPAA